MPIAAVLFGSATCCSAGLINPFINRPEHSQFMLLVAVALILVNVQLIVFGPDAQGVQTPYSFDSFQLGPLIVDAAKVYAAAAALVVAAATVRLLPLHPAGKAIRACADNYSGALVVGLNVKHLYALTFGLGAACVGAAGAMLMVVIDVTPAIGPAYTLLAFVIVITGGLGSMPGALLGGMLIGLTEALGGVLFTPSAKSMFAFGLLVLVLLFRPQGILGRKSRHDQSGLLEGVPRRGLLLLLAPARDFSSPCRFVVSGYLLAVLFLILYFAYVGQAWNIMMGFAGQLSLGHSLYVGLGAYAAAALYVHFGISPWIGLGASIAISAAGRRGDRLPRLPLRRRPACTSPSSPSPSPSSRASASTI